jgi:hypothetical protein
MMPRVVVVEAAKTVDGVRVPVVLRERTGERYVAVATYTKVLTGSAALQEFARAELEE